MYPKGYPSDTLLVPLTSKFNRGFLIAPGNGEAALYMAPPKLAPVKMVARQNSPGQRKNSPQLKKVETGPADSFLMMKGGSFLHGDS